MGHAQCRVVDVARQFRNGCEGRLFWFVVVPENVECGVRKELPAGEKTVGFACLAAVEARPKVAPEVLVKSANEFSDTRKKARLESFVPLGARFALKDEVKVLAQNIHELGLGEGDVPEGQAAPNGQIPRPRQSLSPIQRPIPLPIQSPS